MVVQCIPSGRADELLEILDRLGAAVDILGPPAFGMLRLLAHWATQGGSPRAHVRWSIPDKWDRVDRATVVR